MNTYNIAIVGATGLVGRALIELLAQRDFPVGNLFLLASKKSEGEGIFFKHKECEVQNIESFDFSNVDIAFFMAGSEVSKKHIPKATELGVIVIDNSSHYRNDVDVPLIIPEVNPEDIEFYNRKNIISNPNCSTIQMLVALKPIYDAFGIKKIVVSTYQSVSGAGQKGINELVYQTTNLLGGKSCDTEDFVAFKKQIAFNALPQIDDFQDNGYTKEEMKMILETQKIFHNDNIAVNPTAVRIPVFFGHSESIYIETDREISKEAIEDVYYNYDAVKLIDDVENLKYPTAVEHVRAESDSDNATVFVGRVRQDLGNTNGINLWVVSDNVRKGGALNSIQIAEKLLNYI
mgnify:CR=1 FL=1|tara:strand:+ start:6745 stop:7785 length:1041 start_codon:yes stop_codon:yes gene_type:complete